MKLCMDVYTKDKGIEDFIEKLEHINFLPFFIISGENLLGSGKLSILSFIIWISHFFIILF
jgi:hypothetical protein